MTWQFPRSRALAGSLAAGALLALAACGGGSDGGGTTPPPPALVVGADTVALSAGGSTVSVLGNDTLGGAAATAGAAGNVTVTLVSGTLPAGVSFTDGVFAASGSAAAANFTITYRLCQASLASNCATGTASVTVTAAPAAVGTVSGKVVDATTGLGLSDIQVTAGGVSVLSAGDGTYTLPGVGAGAGVPVRFNGNAFAETVRNADVTASATVTVDARLLPVGARVSVDAAAGGTVTLPSGPAQVVLPPAGLKRADGSAFTGTASVALTAIAPATDTSLMPGNFTTTGTSTTGTPVPIESFGAINVDISDASGAPLNLAAGKTSTIRIPLSSRNPNPPATVPLYWFNNATGHWVEEGTATLQGTFPNQYYEGTVSHFTSWNADFAYAFVTVTGCARDAAGAPVAGARIESDGIDYSGTSQAVTAADGSFTIRLRPGSQATLSGRANGSTSNTVTVTTGSTDSSLSECLVFGGSGTGTGTGITVKLTWGAAPSDLDSHLWTPSGYHLYYSTDGLLTADPYAALDVDDTDSYGPEVITISRLMVGTYRYSVRNYSGQGSGLISASGARVELNIPGRSAELFVPPAGDTLDTGWWNLFEFDVDANCSISLRRVNTFTVNSPSVATAPPTYCTPPASSARAKSLVRR